MAGIGFRNNNANNLSPVPVSDSGANTRLPLSAITSSYQYPLDVGTSTTLVHSAPNHVLDEIYLWASNYGAADTYLTISFATSSVSAFSGHKNIVVPVNKDVGLSLVLPGNPISNTNVYVKSAAASSLNIVGFTVRYFQKDNLNAAKGYFGPYVYGEDKLNV